MMSVSDVSYYTFYVFLPLASLLVLVFHDAFFYSVREPLWIVRTPNSAQKSGSNNSQTPQHNQTAHYSQNLQYSQSPQYSHQGVQYSTLQAVPYNLQTAQFHNLDVNGDIDHQVVELKVPVCCEACEDRVKHALLSFNGVESVQTDTYTQRVAVKGNVAPADILRICRKLHKKSELLQKKGSEKIIGSPKW